MLKENIYVMLTLFVSECNTYTNWNIGLEKKILVKYIQENIFLILSEFFNFN